MAEFTSVWVFNGVRSNFPSGIFTERNVAEAWIRDRGLTGTLTLYPVDVSAYDWALSKGFFVPKRDDQRSAEFIGRFSDASQEHHHYEDGALA